MSREDKAGQSLLGSILDDISQEAIELGRPTFDAFLVRAGQSNVPEEALSAIRRENNRELQSGNIPNDVYLGMAERVYEHRFNTEEEARYAIQYGFTVGTVKLLSRMEQQTAATKEGLKELYYGLAQILNVEPDKVFETLQQSPFASLPQIQQVLARGPLEQYLKEEDPNLEAMREEALKSYGMMQIIRKRDKNKPMNVAEVIENDLKTLANGRRDKFSEAENVVENYFSNPLKVNRMILMGGTGNNR